MGAAETRTSVASVAVSGNRLRGYAAVFGEETVIEGDYREVILPGAFKESLKRRDVLALVQHNRQRLLGRTSSGTLRLEEDRVGLRFELDVDPSTPDGATVSALVARGDLFGMSFGFGVRADDWTPHPVLPLRKLLQIDLGEISIVDIPAYAGASVRPASGGLGALEASKRAAEAAMRKRGLL